MSKKIVINPLTRISGFLEIQVDIEDNKIINAKSSGMLFRGFEKMLQGRPPLDVIYFTQRICGICSTAHSIASAAALEDAIKIIPDKNDNLIREFIHGCEFLQNHLRHFYQYTFPDYVNGPEINPVYKESYGDYRLSKALNTKLSSHYIESVKYSRLAHKMLAILAGKAPHNHGVFVGGVTVNFNSSIYIELVSILSSIERFITEVMEEDVNIISKYYEDYFHNGIGYGNFMSFGVFDSPFDEPLIYVRPKVLINGLRKELDVNNISENIYYSWYEARSDTIRPKDGYVEPNLDKKDAYSWIKAPRYNGYPMEVGPLARMWLSGEYVKGISTMDRTIARVLEAKKVCKVLKNLLNKVELKPASQNVYNIPDEATGIGTKGTTRGALGHWISIKDQKIKNYTIITPTTWNLSPRDSKGVMGVVEKALVGTYVKNPKNPVEIGRIVRSFDPCVSCATHIFSGKSNNLKVQIV